MATKQEMNPPEDDSSTILRTVPYDNGFNFNTENDAYTGLTAINLEQAQL